MLLHSTPFLSGHGCPAPFLPALRRAPAPSPQRPLTSAPPPIRAMKKLQGRVVCTTNDKTVAVEVVRLAPHPKYKRRVRIKKKYQAHDPDNRFAVGDFVQLEKSRPISKTKAFLAVPVVATNAPRAKLEVPAALRDLPPELQSKPAEDAEADADADAAQQPQDED